MNVDSATSPRLLFVSTYPPTRCGIATFTRSLVYAVGKVRNGRQPSGVIRLLPGWDTWAPSGPEVVAETDVGSIQWADEIDAWCRGYDMVWIQHEFGIFGPEDGVNVLELCEVSPVPIGVTLHTIPVSPTDPQRAILEGLGRSAEFVVVMSEQAARRLLDRYDIDRHKVQVVPHGAQTFPLALEHRDPGRRPTIVNWGLIGPGKGLEWGIRAMALLQHLDPKPRLVIRGTTHPNVQRREGELYRDQLLGLAHELGLSDSVEIQGGYMTDDELRSLIQVADLALLPYDTRDQVTSGVLVDAIGAGLPVVATSFPHAVELLSSGAGRLVPQGDSAAMAEAIEELLSHRPVLKAAAEEARRVGRQFAWPRVALQYERLARTVLTRDNKSVA